MADGMGRWLPLISTAWPPPFLSGRPVSALTNKETLAGPSRLTLCYLGPQCPHTHNLGLLWWRSPAEIETQEVVWDRDELSTYKTRPEIWIGGWQGALPLKTLGRAFPESVPGDLALCLRYSNPCFRLDVPSPSLPLYPALPPCPSTLLSSPCPPLWTGSYYVAQDNLKCRILLPQPSKCWYFRCGRPHQTCSLFKGTTLNPDILKILTDHWN